MKSALTVLSFFLAFALVSCKPLAPKVTSQDCLAAAPANFTRIYIGTPAHGGQQTGTSFDDPLDGTTAEKFDTILRSIAEGQNPTWGVQKNIAAENLVVCLASGTFQTEGQYDWTTGVGHSQGSVRGFTVRKNWKIHGRGVDQTKLQLASYLTDQFVVPNGTPISGGRNVVIGTHSEDSSAIEISDLTVDANHDHLTVPGGFPLNLEGIVLRTQQGGHWIHNVNVIGGSGDVGFLSVLFETFAIHLWGTANPLDPLQNVNNIIENVNVGNPGRPTVSGSPAGGAMDGIVVNNAVAEVRNNVVDGYQVGYGGWAMGPVKFHDNIARNIAYGFNADSFTNSGVVLQSNQFIGPSSYGVVIGGGNPGVSFSNWTLVNNTIQLSNSGSVAFVLRGQVENSTFARNTILATGSGRNLTAIWSYPAVSGVANGNNVFEDNHVDKAVVMNFSRDPNFNTNCRFQNRDLQGNLRQDFPDNSSAGCR
jgi:hypothetical protein